VHAARISFPFLATIWVVLLATAPSAMFGAPLSALVYAFGALVCHQRPERSFYFGPAQVPVCARCYGIYLGAAIGALAVVMVSSAFNSIAYPRTRARMRNLLLVSAAPTALTWTSEIAGVWAASNATRFIAALPLGIAVALTVNYVECARPQRNESTRRPTPM
jgi:uncharacterized membrane protein